MTFDYLIVAGGQLPALKFTKDLIKISKNIVTVDRGANLALKLNLRPLLHVGDGDSFSKSNLKKLKASAVVNLPKRKSISDLEFAINHLGDSKTKLVIGAHKDFEGRADHAFLNLLLLSRSRNLYFTDEKIWVTLLNTKRTFSFSAFKNTIFTVATMGQRTKVTISGSRYDGKSKVFNFATQGLSNLTRSKWTHIKTTGPALIFVSSNLHQTKIDDSSLI